MENVFSIFDNISTEKKPDESTPEIFNSELDIDPPLPEGSDMPPVDELLSITARVEHTLDSGHMAIDETPHPASGTGTRSPSPADLGEDLVSVETDVNRHNDEIAELGSRMSQIEKRLLVVTSLDDRLRRLESLLDNVLTKEKETSLSQADLIKSFNIYQTNTARAIADVERRAATKQLRPEPIIESEKIIPPPEVSASRVAAYPDSGTTPTQATIASSASPKIADLSDW